jgi:hypothetical protein
VSVRNASAIRPKATVLYCRNLKSKAKHESSLSYYSFKH